MFGMGTTLSVRDFARVFTMPWPVFIGMTLQYTVMPLAGFAIATSFGFPPEVAARVVLIGSCPGGVASNLMTYLARGMNNKGIAAELFISERTVRFHLRNIYDKLYIKSRTEAVIWAIKNILSGKNYTNN